MLKNVYFGNILKFQIYSLSYSANTRHVCTYLNALSHGDYKYSQDIPDFFDFFFDFFLLLTLLWHFGSAHAFTFLMVIQNTVLKFNKLGKKVFPAFFPHFERVVCARLPRMECDWIESAMALKKQRHDEWIVTTTLITRRHHTHELQGYWIYKRHCG